ncbi:hypothetical protein UFOVP435_17 [uncultured Caudovirales phage]|uniref:Uncharacterized protein n=1 Tax=uncultured Caudovirales phage TaxID=2100421 RepID=A0A6J5M952_9CAUD|nr:hypothetical protein UFOVP435_17 [uncultured Caudovirales phage]
MPDNVTANPGAGGAAFRTLSDGLVNWPASVVAYATTVADGANVLQPVTPGFGMPVAQQGAWSFTLTGTAAVTGPLTNAQLRATAVPVSGPLTDAELRASAVSVSGPLTNAQLRAAAVPVLGPLTDAELRAAAVPVSGPLTDTQLRAAAVPVSATALPLPAGAAAETTLVALNTKIPALGQAAMAASQPVAIASDQSPIPTVENATVLIGAAAQTAIVNNILPAASGAAATPCENFRAATVQVVSTGTAGTFIFEQSNDDVNFVPLPVFNAALVTGVPITAAITATASAILYTFPIRARFVRLRIATLITGGSIQAFTRLSSEPWTAAAQLVASNSAANMQVTASGTVANGAGTARIGFVATAGIWFDDSTTVLAANAPFTGTSRDLTVTATATAFANAATYAKEFRVSAESDVAGTLWIEASRDNTVWRRMKSVATAAIPGGGFAAEIIHQPSWRFVRVGFTNGATVQARFTIGSMAMAA